VAGTAEELTAQRNSPATCMIRVLFLIRCFERGGSERQLVELMRGMDKTRFDVTVATFYPGGGLLPEVLRIPGVKHICLDKKGRWDVLPFLLRFRRLLKTLRPQIVHGYLAAAYALNPSGAFALRRSNRTRAGASRCSSNLARCFRVSHTWSSRIPMQARNFTPTMVTLDNA
jgi:hypothetical protein